LQLLGVWYVTHCRDLLRHHIDLFDLDVTFGDLQVGGGAEKLELNALTLLIQAL
jgi:hypothetical protein